MSTAREDTTRLADLLRHEHHALAEFLIALAAFDRERRWVELGYSSLFYFLTRELGLPKGPAYYRKTAAELIQEYPEIVEPLRDGRLHLSTITELANVITPENRAEILPRFFGTSKREAREVVAELQPDAAPPMRTVVTAAGAPAPQAANVLVLGPAAAATERDLRGRAARGDVADHVEHAVGGALSTVPAAPVVLPEEPTACQLSVPDVVSPLAPRPQPCKIDPLTATLSRLHVTVSRRLLDKLAAARDALSHSHPGASEETILEVGLDLIIDRYRKRRGIGAKPRSGARATDPAVAPALDPDATAAAPAAQAAADAGAGPVGDPAPAADATPAAASDAGAAALADPSANASPHSAAPPPKRNRHVPAHVWRGVWERDGGRCAWLLESGGVCGSTHQLELDHVDGWALGGVTTIDRCRILCRFHQDVHARKLYGDAHMDEFTNSKGPVCSEPVAAYGTPAQRSGDAPARHREDPLPTLVLYRPRFATRAASSAAASRFTFSRRRARARGAG